MENDNTDSKGKIIASQVIGSVCGSQLQVTKEEYNRLDGWFKYKGHKYGLECKYANNDRFYGFNTIMVAKNKYEHSINEGKYISGLTTTYMLLFTDFPTETDVYICNFSECPNSPLVWKWVPNSHDPNNKEYHWEQFYLVSVDKARKYKIINNQIIEIQEDEKRQDVSDGSSSIEDGFGISCWPLQYDNQHTNKSLFNQMC